MRTFKFFTIALLILLASQFAEAGWTKQKSNTLAWLRDIYFLNEKTGWIAGSSGVFFKTVDGGETWTKEKNFTDDAIRQVYFTNEQNGWLLCERDVFSLGANSPSYLLKTVDGGQNWERVEFKDRQTKRVARVLFAKNGDILAVGEGGAFFKISKDEKVWKQIPSPIRYLLLDGVFSDDAHGAIVGAGGSILFTEDAGVTWKNATIWEKSDAKLNSVFFINPKNGWTVGTSGKIFQTFNGGKIWREQKSNVNEDLTDIFFQNTAEGWAVGDGGTILHTTTAGNIWTTIDSKDTHKLERLAFVGKKGWAVGFGGTILFYDGSRAENKFSNAAPRFKTRN